MYCVFCLLAQFKLKDVELQKESDCVREREVCGCLEFASFFVSAVGLSDKHTGRLTVCERCCVCCRGQIEYAVRLWGLQSRTTLTQQSPTKQDKNSPAWSLKSLDASQHCATHHVLLSVVLSYELMSWEESWTWCFQRERTLSYVLSWTPAE